MRVAIAAGRTADELKVFERNAGLKVRQTRKYDGAAAVRREHRVQFVAIDVAPEFQRVAARHPGKGVAIHEDILNAALGESGRDAEDVVAADDQHLWSIRRRERGERQERRIAALVLDAHLIEQVFT